MEARYNLGNAFFQKGKIDEAILNYQQAIQAKPNYLSATYKSRYGVQQKERTDDAIAQFRRALELQPDSPKPAITSAMLSFKNERKLNESTTCSGLCKSSPTFPTPSTISPGNWRPRHKLRCATANRQLNWRSELTTSPTEKTWMFSTHLRRPTPKAGQFPEAVLNREKKQFDLAQASGQADRLKQFNTELQSYEANASHSIGMANELEPTLLYLREFAAETEAVFFPGVVEAAQFNFENHRAA